MIPPEAPELREPTPPLVQPVVEEEQKQEKYQLPPADAVIIPDKEFGDDDIPAVPSKNKKKQAPKPQPKKKPDTDCLLVSCSELVPLFADQLKLKCDESFLEESAINSVQKSIQRQTSGEGAAYKFIFVDLDDPTLMLGRFMVSLNRVLAGHEDIKIQVFATASTSSERMLKKCEEVKVKFIPKPIFETKLRFQLKPYLK